MIQKLAARGGVIAALTLLNGYRDSGGRAFDEPQASPRFKLSADTVLIDDVVGIAVTGLPAGQHVTIRVERLETA